MASKWLNLLVNVCVVVFNIAIIPLSFRFLLGPVNGMAGFQRLGAYLFVIYAAFRVIKYIFDELSPWLFKHYGKKGLVWFLSIHFDKDRRIEMTHDECIKGLFCYVFLFCGATALSLIGLIIGGVTALRNMLKSKPPTYAS